MRVVVWVTEGTWQAAVDAARDLPGADVTLLHVIDVNTVQAIAGARAGLLGRGHSYDAAGAAEQALTEAQHALLAGAQERLGPPAPPLARQGRLGPGDLAPRAGPGPPGAGPRRD